ncbi:MAG: hypothetical protein MR487_07685, partial [Lachnospiraceae bacterium]|nr:hypothetical protein [Lachnospiraceae bacterium]
SNLEMTESESGALPFGDTPLSVGSVSRLRYYIILQNKKQVFFLFFLTITKTHSLSALFRASRLKYKVFSRLAINSNYKVFWSGSAPGNHYLFPTSYDTIERKGESFSSNVSFSAEKKEEVTALWIIKNGLTAF